MAGDDEEMCPICRSSRYLNPDMKFLVNPECYHKMCESCVDRIFSGGPAPCPFRGCGRTLRKSRFKKQVFDDLVVEREVDVRQRILRIFNRPEDTFQTAGDYNNYLEHIETLIFDIAQGSESEKQVAQAKVAAYERDHKQEILENALEQRQRLKKAEEATARDADRQRRLRLLAIQLQSQEDDYRALLEQETLASLAAGKNSAQARRDAIARLEERTASLKEQYEAEKAALSAPAPQEKPMTPRTPWTPFAGDRQLAESFEFRGEYYDPLLAKADPVLRAGGFSVAAAQRQALTIAFMSLDVDIQHEKMTQAEAAH